MNTYEKRGEGGPSAKYKINPGRKWPRGPDTSHRRLLRRRVLRSAIGPNGGAAFGYRGLGQVDVEEGQPVLNGLEGKAEEDEDYTEYAEAALGEMIGVKLDVRI